MQHSEESLRQQIALGWIACLVVLVLTLQSMTLDGLFTDEGLFGLRFHPGPRGLVFLEVVSTIHVLLAILVFAIKPEWRIVKWLFVAVAGLMFSMFMMHYLSHWVYGQLRTPRAHLLHVEHHVVMGWTLYKTVTWARVPRA
jgi:hypothetical protein